MKTPKQWAAWVWKKRSGDKSMDGQDLPNIEDAVRRAVIEERECCARIVDEGMGSAIIRMRRSE